MKLLKKSIEKDGHGEIKLLPQEEEDMWHIYNLIAPGDLVGILIVLIVMVDD